MEKGKPIFFIGGRLRGYLLINYLVKNRENLTGAIIMKEDRHETEKYFDKIVKFLRKNQIPYLTANSVSKEKYKNFIKEKKPNITIVMGWRTILSEDIINLPKFGTVAVHESLLPKYRGFAPINWAIINGEKSTGVTLFYLDKKIDNGDIIDQETIKIEKNETAYDVYKKTSEGSLNLLKKNLKRIIKGHVKGRRQDEKFATYTCMRLPEDGQINWNNKAENIYNLIRGLSYPYPGAFTFLNGKKLIIWKASIPTKKTYVGKIPGRVTQIISGLGVEVLTGDSTIVIEDIEFEGKKTNAAELVKSIRTTLGK